MTQRVKRLVTCTVSILVVVSVAAGCGEDPGAGGGGASTTTPTTTEPTESTEQAPDQGKQAQVVTVERSGGIKGDTETDIFAEETIAPEGFTDADMDQILEAASEPELIDVELEPMPKNQCCDRITTQVVVEYDDGSARTYRTIDGVDQPNVFVDFLSML